LAFDADAWENLTVARALAGCADALAAAGFAVELERWEAADGKGLDDLLAAGKAPEVLAGDAARAAIREALDTATAGDEPAPPDELGRLQDVLDAGGPEAIFRDAALMQALADLAAINPAGFAAVRASLRGRVSVRDLDAALRPYRRAAAPGEGPAPPTYFEEGGYTFRNVPTKEGPVAVALASFTGRIVEDLEHDDGAELTRFLAVLGKLPDGAALQRADVPARDFAGMEWILPAWGTRAVVFAGPGTRDHLRAALQLLSGEVPRRTIYKHIGWRKIGDQWLYLHAGGAIGPAGLVDDIPVSLPEPLAGYCLPAPPEGDALAAAVRASIGLLRLGPDRLTFPLLAAIYRATLGDTDFALHLSGPTGCFKSEVAALAQQHFGAALDARHLPAGWTSTANALEGLAFTAKDALLVIDDFAPTGAAADVQRYHREADRLFRGQGNRAGRQRLRPDATLRPGKPPRGLVLSTGEDTPRGQSLRARLLVLEVSPGDFGPAPPDPNPTLSACQRDAAAGLYAAALAGFLRWLAPRLDRLRAGLPDELAELRDRARADGQHARTPAIVGNLALGLRYFLDFAMCAGAVIQGERADLLERGWAGLTEAAAAQGAQIAAGEPAEVFLRLLAAAVASGAAHLADEDGNEPCDPQRWGWRPEETITRDGTATRFKPHGARVGWLVDGEVFLEPDAAFAVAQRFAREQNDSFPITPQTLRRRLKEKGFLATTDTARGKLTVRRTLQGGRREVLNVFWAGNPSAPETGPTGPIGPDGDAGPENGPETWAGPWAGNGQGNGKPAHEPAPVGTSGHSPEPGGPELGRKGRSATGEERTPHGNNSEQQADWGEWQ